MKRFRSVSGAVVALVVLAGLVTALVVPPPAARAGTPAEIAANDLDHDGLSTALERELGTDPVNPDSDGDGLLDGWEVLGYERGGFREPLPEYGANPLVRDLFVEIDWMEAADGSVEKTRENAVIVYQAAVDAVRVFERSDTGIRLRIDLGLDIFDILPREVIEDDVDLGTFAHAPDPQKELPYQAAFGTRPVSHGAVSSRFSLYEVSRDPGYFRPSRRNIFYYFVFAERPPPSVTESSPVERAQVDRFADDAARRLGLRDAGCHAGVFYRYPDPALAGPSRRYHYSVLFLHELGHALGLGHGGRSGGRRDDTNYKINYPSIMNYRYQFWGVDLVRGMPVMDFSHGRFQRFNEQALSEPNGLGYRASDHVLANLALRRVEGSEFRTNIDWNGDGALADAVLRHDVDGDGVIDNRDSRDHDDWGYLLTSGFDGIGRRAFDACGMACGLGGEVRRVTGDFNGDGRTDLFVANATRTAWIVSHETLDYLALPPRREGGIAGRPLVPTQTFLRVERGPSSPDLLAWHSGSALALIRVNLTEAEVVVEAEVEIPAAPGSSWTPWTLAPADHLFASPLRGEGRHLALSNGRDAAIVALVPADPDGDGAARLDVVWRATPSLDAWGVAPGVVIERGRSLPGGHESLLLRGADFIAELRAFENELRAVRIDSAGSIVADGVIEPWRLATGQRVIPLDLDGDALDELLVVDPLRAGVVRPDAGAASLVWSQRGALAGIRLDAADLRVDVGQFVPGGGEEILVSSGSRLAVLAWRDTALVPIASHDGEIPSTSAGPWRLEPRHRIISADFLGSGSTALLVRGKGRLAVARFETGEQPGFRIVELHDDLVGQWALDESDDLVTVEADRDREAEILVSKGELFALLDFPRGAPATSRLLTRLDGETLEFEPVVTFLRGDVNFDAVVDVSDPIFLLTHLFLGAEELQCEDAADVDDSGVLDISDAVVALLYLFAENGLPPPPPGAERPGTDPTVDRMSCGRVP